jgi:hypothetical protein
MAGHRARARQVVIGSLSSTASRLRISIRKTQLSFGHCMAL